jgi:uncharacterized protein YneF (UPF0154 family)
MLQFSLGLVIGIMMGVFIMCLMIMAGRGEEPPVSEEKRECSLSDLAITQVSHPEFK